MGPPAMTLDKKAAKRMMGSMLKCADELNQIVHDAHENCDEVLANTIKRRVGIVMTSMLIDVMNPIGSIYPDLYPPALRPPEVSKLTAKKR